MDTTQKVIVYRSQLEQIKDQSLIVSFDWIMTFLATHLLFDIWLLLMIPCFSVFVKLLTKLYYSFEKTSKVRIYTEIVMKCFGFYYLNNFINTISLMLCLIVLIITAFIKC